MPLGIAVACATCCHSGIWQSGISSQLCILVQKIRYNVIIYANVTLPLTLVSRKLNVQFFSPCYFNRIKTVTPCKCIFKEIVPKLSVDFGNRISHKNQYSGPACNLGFIAPQYNDKCWSDLPLKGTSFSLVTNTKVTVSPTRSSDSCFGWFVWN